MAEGRTLERAGRRLTPFGVIPIVNVVAALLLACGGLEEFEAEARPAPRSRRLMAGAVDACIAYCLMLLPGAGWLLAMLFCLFRDCMFRGGRSPGKLLMGVRVGIEEGRRLSPLTGFLRSALVGVPLLQIPGLLAEAAAVLISGRGIGDFIGGGTVVRSGLPETRPEESGPEGEAVAGDAGLFLSVVIPAYNEEARIGPTLDRVASYLGEKGIAAEIIVVDDGSSDRTAQVATEAAARHGVVRVLSNGRNRGKGFTVRNGVSNARGKYVLFSDADLSTPIEEVGKLLPALESGAGVALASRSIEGSSIEKAQPFARRVMGRVFNLIVRSVALPGVRDSQCGFKCFTREAAAAVFPLQRIEGFAFDVEVLYIARKLGFGIAEVPVRWIDSPDSRVRRLSDPLRMFAEVARIRLNDWSGLYPSRRGGGRKETGGG